MIFPTNRYLNKNHRFKLMRITNKHGLPAPLVRAITYSDYSKEGADYSVTELIKPPRIAALELLHANDLEEDASDRLWLLMGKAGHEVLRRSSEGGIVEERCIVDVAGKKVSGQLDYAVTEQEIIDYKFTSVWAIKDGVKPEWEQQLNCYKWMAEQYGVSVKELKIIAILRDWSKSESKRKPDLPQSQVVVLSARIWTKEAVEVWLRRRIALHENARSGVLPECTSEEVWERPEMFAVTKKGNVRATKLHSTADEAIKHVSSLGSAYEIQRRPGERPRCESYCSVSEYCLQYKSWKEAHGEAS